MTQEQAEQLKTLKADEKWRTVLYTRDLDGTILKWWLNDFIDDKVLVRNIKNSKKYLKIRNLTSGVNLCLITQLTGLHKCLLT